MPAKKKVVKKRVAKKKRSDFRAKPILLVLHPHLGVDREIQRGIQQYALDGLKRWKIMAIPGCNPSPETYRKIADWDLDGVIGSAEWDEQAEAAVKLPFPFVNSCSQLPIPGLPSVGVDDQAVGRMAAEYFWDRGFRNHVFIGNVAEEQSHQRWEGFRQALSEKGVEAHRIEPARGVEDESPENPIWKYLSSASGPTAVFGVFDAKALSALALCQFHGLHVPEQVAILGVDDDDLVCHNVHPALSSIRWPTRKVGYEAARMLDAMMEGKPAPKQPLLFPPVEVVTRQSTDIIAIEDEVVARAVRFIRENACLPISAKQVRREVRQTHQILGVRFKKTLGRTVFQEIQRVRIKHVNHLLRNTDLTLEAIAPEAGFEDGDALAHAYRRFAKISPGAYREKHRFRGDL